MIFIAPKKHAIPEAVRRAVALRYGQPGRGVPAACTYCDRPGKIHWMSASWVIFHDLELDHVIPEVRGGQAVTDNIVLACQRCNRSKGFRRTAAEMVMA